MDSSPSPALTIGCELQTSTIAVSWDRDFDTLNGCAVRYPTIPRGSS